METQTRQLALDSSQNESCGFLTIARELRDMIYGHLLEICPADHCHPDGTAKSYTLPSLAILATNKQIRDEAQAVYGKVNQVVKIETDVDLASMEEPRAIGFLNTKTGQTANDSLRRFNRLAELLGEANLPALKISSASTVKAERGNKAGSLLVMLEDLPDLMLGLYLHQALDGGVVREKASIARLTLKWELPRSTKARMSMSPQELKDFTDTDCRSWHRGWGLDGLPLAM